MDTRQTTWRGQSPWWGGLRRGEGRHNTRSYLVVDTDRDGQLVRRVWMDNYTRLLGMPYSSTCFPPYMNLLPTTSCNEKDMEKKTTMFKECAGGADSPCKAVVCPCAGVNCDRALGHAAHRRHPLSGYHAPPRPAT